MKWIKCSERLPKKNEKQILVFCDRGIITAAYFMGDWHEIHLFGEIAYEIEFTHWAELLEAPNETM